MPIASPETYRAMLDAAKAGNFAYPAINVTSSETLNAALKGFADAESDGIVQISTGGAEFLSGLANKDMPLGATALAMTAFAANSREAEPESRETLFGSLATSNPSGSSIPSSFWNRARQ